jgi:hypothetical protein
MTTQEPEKLTPALLYLFIEEIQMIELLQDYPTAIAKVQRRILSDSSLLPKKPK